MMNEASPIILGIAFPLLCFAVVCAIFPFGSDEGFAALIISAPVSILLAITTLALTHKKK